MSMNDQLANALSKILNAEKKGNVECIIKPSSKMIKKTLELLNKERYIGGYTEIKDSKGNLLKVNLIGSINKCGVIKPRHAAKKQEFKKFEKRFLPAKDFGIILISTNKGLITHKEAKNKGLGGKLIAYCY